jgi:peptidase A4-like protein
VEHVKSRVCTPELPAAWTSRTASTQTQHSAPPSAVVTDSVVGERNSSYWAGIEATGDYGFNQAVAEWNVPTWVAGSPSQSTDVHWVGIGGDGTNLWQAGIEVDQRYGYRFWYEYYSPQHTCCAVFAGPAISAGNEVSTYVDYCYTVNCQSYVYMVNQTTGQSWSKSVNFQPSQGDVEFISERSTFGSCLSQLTQWSPSINWINVTASSPQYGHLRTLATFPDYGWTMYDQYSTLLASHSGIGSDGESFSTTWRAYGAYNGC